MVLAREFAFYILGLPVPAIRQNGPSASAVILPEGESAAPEFGNLDAVLAQPDVQLRLFGKPEVSGRRRMGVVVARGESAEQARRVAMEAASKVTVKL